MLYTALWICFISVQPRLFKGDYNHSSFSLNGDQLINTLMFHKARDYMRRTKWTYSTVHKQGGVIMTYIVGIDIAKYKHECLVIDQSGKIIIKSFSFDNNVQGFDFFLSKMNSLLDPSKIKIGFESTGHYTANLKSLLIKSDYDFMEIHPVLINRFTKATTLRKTKTDKVDVGIICSYMNSVEYKPYSTKSYHTKYFNSLTRSRDSLVKERSLQLQRMTNTLDYIFPEFKPFFRGSLKSATAQYLLLNYGTPTKIARMNHTSYKKMSSELRRTISYARFVSLRALAKNTVGEQSPLFEFQLEKYLSLYTMLNNIIEETDKLILEEFSKVDTYLQSIPGIGPISAATIMSEIGSIENFSNPSQLVAYAGLDPAFYQSGESTFTGKMVKRGSSLLRQVLMNCAQYSLVHNPQMYDYYLKKRSEGKAHRVALSHVAKKLIRIIFALETQQIMFNPEQMK